MSFFGGGTDYPAWYRSEGGSVISTTINKYLFLSCHELPPFFEMRHRIIWSKIENVCSIEKIEHPAIREGLKFLGFDNQVGLDIHYQADLPGLSGMGSSSSFAVGLINTLSAFQGKHLDRHELALKAIHLESNLLDEAVGVQDQLAAAYGGFNRMRFNSDGELSVSPVQISAERMARLEDHLMLFFTSLTRYAFHVAADIISNIMTKKITLTRINDIVDEASSILSSEASLTPIGELLHESWHLKKMLSQQVSTERIDEIYDAAMSSGAVGGKLLGAGGGGMILFFVPPEKQDQVRAKFKGLLEVPFKFSNQGSMVRVLK